MTNSKNPVISLALPVFNGENFVKEALESIREQTFTDYELIISDNASTDSTEEICRAFAEADSRVRYFRNETNIGAGPNFNLAFSYATGRYFKWVSHDDTMAPDYLARTLAMLEANPDAALCHSLIKLIDGRGETLDIHDTKLVGADSARASERFAAMSLIPHQCLELDGLIPADVLAKTQLVPSYPGGDRALLCEIALCGPILKIEEPIFMTREHPERFRVSAASPEDRVAFYNTEKKGQRRVWTWHLYSDYWRMVWQHVDDRRERMRCVGHLLHWWFKNWNSARIVVDIIALMSPTFLRRAERFKQAVFSPQPGPDPGARKDA